MAYIQGTTGSNISGGGTIQTANFGTQPTVGNAIIVVVQTNHSAPAVNSVTDSANNTYVKAKPQNIPSPVSGDVEMWYAVNIATTTNFNVTANVVNGATGNVVAQEHSSIVSSNPLDQTASASGTSNAPNSGNTPTTTNASEALIGAVGTDAGPTISLGSGYSNLTAKNTAGNGNGTGEESEYVAATGQYAATFSLSSSKAWGAIIATFLITTTSTSTSTTTTSTSTTTTSTSTTSSTSTSTSTTTTSTSTSTTITTTSTTQTTSSTSTTTTSTSTTTTSTSSTTSTTTTSTSTTSSTSTTTSLTNLPSNISFRVDKDPAQNSMYVQR